MDRSAGCTLCQNWFYRDIASRREDLNSSALSDMYRFFILVFGLFYAKVLCRVFLGFFRECSHANVLLCLFSRTTHFTFTLRLLRFPKKLAKQRFKRPKPMFIGWICDSLNQSGHGGETKRQQSFLFGSEGRNALVSSDQSMLSKYEDVITYATEPLNIQMRQLRYLRRKKRIISAFRHFKAFR